jgi:hypothetical protein
LPNNNEMTITMVREIEKQKTAVILEYQEGGSRET